MSVRGAFEERCKATRVVRGGETHVVGVMVATKSHREAAVFREMDRLIQF